jgi:hypothetical protein
MHSGLLGLSSDSFAVKKSRPAGRLSFSGTMTKGERTTVSYTLTGCLLPTATGVSQL